ncbi:MAG TPA: creatininase family protein [Phycisphaerae bacterium]|nr:creatininase family protein [Phycisphaerae bacterium]
MPRTYHVENLRGPELDEAVRECPVVYVPFGIIEWHGPHLPLGMDTFACQAVVNHAAENHGGLVWPTCWFHDHYASVLPLMRELFQYLYNAGFRVIVTVTVHNGRGLLPLVKNAARHLRYDKKIELLATMVGSSTGFGDHGAMCETSYMLHTNPQDVDMSALDGKEITLDMSPPLGIGGSGSPLDATAEAGEQAVKDEGDIIGKEAMGLLNSLTPEQRKFHLPAISPEYWWHG